MITCIRTNWENSDFQKLVAALDDELKIRDGADNSFYARFNSIDKIQYAVVAYENGMAAGCGAIKEFSHDTVEVKRMYVAPGLRGRGIASTVLVELETWARELNYGNCVLETGKRQPEAIGLYKKSGYQIIPNYGPYKDIDNSVCFAKTW
jgi:putative acetyltransferase